MAQSAVTTTSPAWLVFSSFVTLLGILAVAVPSTVKVLSSDSAAASTPTSNVSVIADASNDGTDVTRPVLAPADASFVDKRGGWGWGDRCWLNIKAEKWGWARAECERAMTLNPKSPQPMASLLYNRGLIAIHAGDTQTAKQLLEQSLQLREHPEVRAVYRRLQQ